MARNRSRSPGRKPRSAAKRTVTDGPFAETKELAGFWLKPEEETTEAESELEVVTTGEFRSPHGIPE